MPDHTLGRWLLVALAIIGLAVVMSPVSAHGDAPTPTETAAEETPGDNETADVHATHYPGTETVEWMESRMGVLADGMGLHASDSGHVNASHDDASHEHATHDDTSHEHATHDDTSHDRRHGC